MADLTPAQLTFLQTYIGYDTKGYFQKRSLKSQLQEFWRRRDKALSEIRALPPEHPQLAALQQAMDSANAKAEGGDLKGAYNDLKVVKEDARAAATVVRNGVTLGTVVGDINVLETAIRRFRAEHARILDRAADGTQDIIDEAGMLRDPGSGADRDEIIKIVGENMRRKQDILMECDALTVNVTQDVQTYRALFANPPTVPSLLALIAHNIVLLNQKDPNASKGQHNARYATCDQQCRALHLSGNGAELASEIDAKLKARREDLLNMLRQKTVPPHMEVLGGTDNSGKRLEGMEAGAAMEAMAERFRHLEAEEVKRMKEIKRRYLAALGRDMTELDQPQDDTPVRDSKPRPFDTADMMDALDIDVTDTRKRPDQIAEAAAAGVADALRDLLADGSVPDEAFEMCSRSQRDWYIEAAKAAGIRFDPDDPSTIDPTVWAKIKAAGDAMQKAAQAGYPDKAKVDGEGQLTEFTLGGVTFGELKQLGRGGGGVVYSAVDGTGNKVVVKVPLGYDGNDPMDEKTHQDLRSEASNHRAVSGGEDGDCPPNVLDMKGMVLAPNGAPLIVMDLAGSGDAERFTNAMGVAEKTGLISDGAKQAMMAQQMREIVTGMKAMQASGMTHHDLKEANVFIGDDGTFKVADFGLARHVDGRDGKVDGLEEFTPGYQPPELLGEGEVTQKSDNFTLGEILDRIADPLSKLGEFRENFSVENPGPAQKTDADEKPVAVSALTRLVNGLKDPDPAKRPTLDAVLMSSYFDEVDRSYTKEDLKRLQVATVAYAKTAGRETADLNRELNTAEGKIRQLELSKSDGLVLMRIRQQEILKSQEESRHRRKLAELQRETDDKLRAALQAVVDGAAEHVREIDQKLQGLNAKLGDVKSRVEIEEIDKQIAAQRKKVADLKKEIAAVHDKDEYKDILAELDDANKAFA